MDALGTSTTMQNCPAEQLISGMMMDRERPKRLSARQKGKLDMTEWQGSTKAQALASGALIYIDRQTLGVLPSDGMTLRVRHDDGNETVGTIVSASAEAIRFEAEGIAWTIGPASEAAPTAVEGGRILEAWIVI